MTAKIINGKILSDKIRLIIKQEIEALTSEKGRPPCLAVILVGEDPASKIYVSHKEKACLATGFLSKTYRMPAETSQQSVLNLIELLNNDIGVDGILLQLPLPTHINKSLCVENIKPAKDVDGLHPINQGRLLARENCIYPCTPLGIIKLIESVENDLSGNEITIKFLQQAKDYLKPNGIIFVITSSLSEEIDFKKLGYIEREIGCETLFMERLCVWELTPL